MSFDFTDLSVCAVRTEERKAAELFSHEICKRTKTAPQISETRSAPCVCFTQCEELPDKDSFQIQSDNGVLTIRGKGIRSFIYGYSLFLRKTVYRDGRISLTESVDGVYTPDKRIRGHQLGYRACSNTYDAWTPQTYRQYYLDIMAFGSNTVEHIPARGGGKQGALMHMDADDLCMEAAKIADAFDLDVSLWFPNDDLSVEETTAVRKAFFEKCPRLNVVFPPGGDPGNYPAEAFTERVKAISNALKAVKPQAQMWPSAQAPHSVPGWGDAFIAQMEELPPEIDGVITGPNRAFPIDVLRRKLPVQYPIRLYPDITHNVRCEYPVHALRDDWHYAFASTLSRESINPRAQEYRLIHRLTRKYIVGSVSYSEGVNDDVNKMVWADMDFDPERSLRDTLLDYARMFLWQCDAERIADGILALEQNWIGDPAENPTIEYTLQLFEGLAEETPELSENWRFCQLLFRACCDAYVRRRRVYDLRLLAKAREALRHNRLEDARQVLRTPYRADILKLREEISSLADRLYQQIGMQLSVEKHGASQWERGATLDTIDLPVTDKEYYLNRLDYAEGLAPERKEAFIDGLLNRCRAPKDGLYFSFSEHGFDVLGEAQTPDYYMDFQGDDPQKNNGSFPMAQLKLFDHFSFRCKLAVKPGCDYKLRVSYSSKKTDSVTAHRVSLDGRTVYCGAQYGGEKDAQFDREYLAPGTETATYLLPAEMFENGCAELIIEEPTVGVMLSEFWIYPA